MLSETSKKPYLIRAIHEWCLDNGYTPYILVAVIDGDTQVPTQYVEDNEIVLNISVDATKDLSLANDRISFLATFSGTVHEVIVPTGAVLSIFARETGDGMQFEYEEPSAVEHGAERGKLSLLADSEEAESGQEEGESPVVLAGHPKLTIVE